MKILAVSDNECPALWEYYVPGRLDEYDLILSCGDLKAAYLTFLVTMSHARLLYVHGNHDGEYASRPPEGCEDIDGQLVIWNGVRILGLGGCLRYNPGVDQYTEREMKSRIRKLRRAIKKAGGVDVVVTHAPPKGHGDLPDPAHTGFEAFVGLIEEYRPRYFLHGHTHLSYSHGVPREHVLGDTRIINVSERLELDYPARADRAAEILWVSDHREPDVREGLF
ncbi:MAG: metallophosphoesterase family protein [Clostridia bacterium]|nr:metallophosphoesterase family protein [Clostridia bacterium]